MVRVEDAVIAKLKKDGQNFEILVDCELALKLKHGEKVDINDVLAVRNIFKDAKKGEVAPNIENVFGTKNVEEIAIKIIKEGEVQLTAEYKRKMAEEKKRKIIAKIVESAMDPKTRLPIPPTRIELAMEQAHINIDPFKPVEEQLKEVVEKLRPILPLSFEKKKFEVIIPARFSASCYGILKKYGKILKENWLSSGALQAEVEMPAKLAEDFVDELNKKTHGDVQIEEKR
ncbi:MAG: ribosome assembly factor SBDS [Nanoarchaeota archaeon]|nr:ribosome assembly factor SBDS [Nanoarchaeota archaeon]